MLVYSFRPPSQCSRPILRKPRNMSVTVGVSFEMSTLAIFNLSTNVFILYLVSCEIKSTVSGKTYHARPLCYINST